MLKEYMSKLPFLQGSQNKRSRQQSAGPAPKPVEPEEELWPEGDPFADAPAPVEEPAELAGSFNYEFICGISKRVPRVYYHGGEPVSVRTEFA